jgi:GAF domain-containing protein
MKEAPIPKNELERIASVYALDLLDTPAEERFDQLTRCATLIFHVPISTLTIIDAAREWFKSCQGLAKTEGDRAISFCGHALVENRILVVEDTLKDERFADNPMVVSDPYIRFYAGVPVMSSDGQRIGVFCIKDTKPREFSKEDQEILEGLAKWAQLEINSRNLSLSMRDNFMEDYSKKNKKK